MTRKNYALSPTAFQRTTYHYNSMEQKKVLFVTQEVYPYVQETQLSKMGCDVPQSIHGRKYEARIFTPKYGCINERRNQLHEVIRLSGLNISIDDNDHPLIIKVATLLPSRMQVYFIDNDDYFHPAPGRGLETEEEKADNDERMMFYTSGVLETVKKLRWQPALIHCSGWISTLAPMYLRTNYADDPTFRSSRIVYSLQSENLDDTLDERFVEKLRMNGFPEEILSSLGEGPVSLRHLSKLAIDHADAIVQLSETPDPELLDYAIKTGKPFLPYVADELRKERILDFYDTLTDVDDDID